MERNTEIEDAIRIAMRDWHFRTRRVNQFIETRTYGQKLELEVRIGVVPKKSGTNTLYWENAYNYVLRLARATGSKITKSQYVTETTVNKIDNYTYRKTHVRGQEPFWQIKKEVMLPRVNTSDEWLKISLAVEELSRKPMEPSEVTVRYISRHSFHIYPCRIDMSKVYMDGETYYEVEVEYQPKKLVYYYDDEEREKLQKQQPDSLLIKRKRMLFAPFIPNAWLLEQQGYDPYSEYYGEFKHDPLPDIVNQEAIEFTAIVIAIRNAMFETPLSFTYTMLSKLSARVNYELSGVESNFRYIDRRYLPTAINLPTPQFNTLFGKIDNPNDYRLSTKIDGKGMLMIVCDTGTWFIFPPRSSSLQCFTDRHLSMQMTILDGEYADRLSMDGTPILDDNGIAKKGFWVSDAFMIGGKCLNTYPHNTRYEAAVEWVQNLMDNEIGDVLPAGIPIFFKSQVSTNHISRSFYSAVEKIYNISYDSFNYAEKIFLREPNGKWITGANEKTYIDGIIFTPTNVPYTNTSDNGIEYSKGNYGLFKWKKEYTIDFKVKIVSGQVKLYFASTDERNEIEFEGTNKYPFKGVVSMDNIIASTGEIVEFEYKHNPKDVGQKVMTGTYRAVRKRSDKNGPNRQIVVEDNYLKTVANSKKLSYNDLLGKTNIIMRRYHGRIIKDLHYRDSHGRKKILLDIGSGRGGPLTSWGEYSLILCVEPRDENIIEFKDRLKKFPHLKEKVKILKAQGEDHEEITEFVKEFTEDGKVDTVSMMNSLTFFFDNKRENLKKLAITINNCLKREGNFLWKAMDGKLVRDRMANGNVLEFGETDSITYNPKKNMFHTIIAPHIHDDEFLFDEGDMRKYLKVSGTPNVANQELILISPYKELSSLYRYGIYTYKGKTKLSPILTNIFGAYVVGEPAKRHSIIEAVESIFTSTNHRMLLDRYAMIAMDTDSSKVVAGTQMQRLRFETAHQGYFLKQFANENWKYNEKEILYLNPSKKDIIDYSFAFASLLELDIILIDEDNEFISTNAVKHSSNACLVVQILDDGEYKVYSKDDMYVFSHKDEFVRNLIVRIPSVSITKIYSDSFTQPLEVVNCSVNLLYGLVTSDADIDTREYALANMILKEGRRVCSKDECELLRIKSMRDSDLKRIDKIIVSLL